MIVSLTPAEMMLGALAGVMRQVENVRNNRQPTYGAGHEFDWQLHIEGALGEMALAKFLRVYWGGKGRNGAPDVGTLDVRTAALHSHSLILHPHDDDGRTVWFLTGCNGTYRVRGWIVARDGKRPEYWQDKGNGRPAFFVPCTALMPIAP